MSDYDVGLSLSNYKKIDNVNNPKHYISHPSDVACIQVTEHLGNAIKYIWRADFNDNAIEDLKKAIFYINQELKRRGEK